LHSVEDVILDHPEASLWDRIDTPEREGPQEILELALVRTVERLEKSLGRDRREWRWDRLHVYMYRHPADQFPVIRRMVNRGPYPAPGGYNTVNVAQYNAGMGSFETDVLPVLRMIAPLGRLEDTRVMMAMGQSGQPGHRHYDDMIEPFIAGRMVPLALSRQDTEHAARLLLTP
jgi:penicillin amidase